MRSTAVIMNDAMDCLLKNLGVIETEIFISTLKREKFDYTEWRKDKFGDMSAEELNAAAAEYGRLHHKG
ncbi:MAG: hypothetical protein NC253_09830 [Ruminococcus sp.]|nr:hypothetical protein [Ruminococcus sp.]MCM1381217.1 hypothetical protein [Muribaculaceae bacterium]MCM1478430.1 hypothetical protein [Muribaculaceae bacterium]